MKILLLALVLATLPPALAQTQAEMNEESMADFQRADAKLNAIYAKVKALMDDEGQAKLKAAQRAWLAFRIAESDLQADAGARGGTLAPTIANGVSQQLTETRTEQLKALLEQLQPR